MAYKRCLIATTKNLFDSNNIDSTYLGVSYKTIGNGRIKLNGNKQEGKNIYSVTTPNITLPAGTYTLSCKFISGSIENPEDNFNKYIYFGINKSTYDFRASGVGYIGDYKTKSFTLTEDTLLTSFDITAGYTSGFAIDNVVIECQLEKGDTATSYVPYGYLPSYKKIIKVNNNPVQLLDKTKYSATQTIDGVTFTNNGDGTITYNGVTSVGANYTLQSGLKVVSGHKYLSYVGENTNDKISVLLYANEDPYDTFDNRFPNADGGISTALKNSNELYYQPKPLSNISFSNFILKPQFFDLTAMYGFGNEPSTVAEFRAKYPNDYYDYNPSQHLVSYRKNLITDGSSKNLFNINSVSFFTKDSNGEYKGNKHIHTDDVLWTPVDGTKQVTISGYIKCPIGKNYMFRIVYTDGTDLYRDLISTGNYIYQTITSDSSKTVSYIGFIYNSGSDEVYIKDVQIEYGSTATSYVPYQYL